MSGGDRPRLLVQRLASAGADLPAPRYSTARAAGLDLAAAVSEPLVLSPGERALIPTGFAVALPAGHEGQVRPRSGLAHRHGITLLNSPGTIDEDYRGEVKVILVNHGREAFVVERGMRIAQLIIAPVTQAEIAECESLPETDRGAGGFGHTGT